ncbi:MAG: NADH-quinone oxidoreductase subunit L [Candidatus Omnitrophica bacterium]|nr:NADH-quinone oxidoreductase subunit L [Candidatus Omnitrophota bacterium]
MDYKLILLAAIFVPSLGAFFLPLAGKFSPRLRNLLALVFVLTSFLCSLKLIPLALSGQAVTFSKTLCFGINLIFVADSLAVFMALVSSFIGAVIIFYSFGYINHYEHQDEYYFIVTLFLGAMMGLVFSANLIFLYLFWEITAVACWRLIGFFREKQHVLKADKALLVTVFGALVMLIGFIALYQQTGSFDLPVIKEKLGHSYVSNWVLILILVGILSKSATLPFHTWLPDAGVAPSPVTALLHAAVLVKIGVYVFARLFIATFNLEAFWYVVLPVIAAISAIVSALAAFKENDLKRLIAYSTVSQIGFIFLGLATNNEIGIFAGLLYILMHGIAKAGLFLCAGIVEQNTKTKDITKLGGLIKTMPVTAISFLLCAFSVMGIPPFGGFFSKYLIIMGPVRQGHILIGFTFLIGAFLTVLYLLRAFTLVFLGDPAAFVAKEKSRGMVFSVALLAFLSLAGGIFISFPSILAKSAVDQMMLGMLR